jgi:hypothetical protein
VYLCSLVKAYSGYVAGNLHKWTNVGSFTTAASESVMPAAIAYEAIDTVILGSSSAEHGGHDSGSSGKALSCMVNAHDHIG